VTRRWALGAVSLFITGCLNPPPAVKTPAAPAESQKVAPSAVTGAETTPEVKGVKFLPPQIGAVQKISCASPQLPTELRLSGRTYLVSAKICVSNAGVVDGVSILAGNEPALVTNVMNAVKEWRYTPLTVNGAAVPFCYLAQFQFKAL
jgi:outer membrane biosynthesis protein TonB